MCINKFDDEVQLAITFLLEIMMKRKLSFKVARSCSQIFDNIKAKKKKKNLLQL